MLLATAACAAGPPSPATPAGPAATPGPALTDLTRLAARRIALSDTVAAAKFGTPSPIEDPARERRVVDDAAAVASREGLDPARAQTFFRDQIEASKVVQRGLFRLWADRVDLRPRARPDLGAVRPELDRIGAQMVAGLRATSPVRAGAGCPAALSADAAAVPGDALHREALDVALRSVCGTS
ncbi:gamma subclass chorismate mutase AroQ [Pseudonocardia sp. KRD-291]|nr:gamma subclass chorismate mutase AroQ [Pseudonocardia sp. KRD291]